MSESNHTPEPWRVEYDKTNPHLAYAIRCQPDERDSGTTVCEMISSRGPVETAANARLMAQAPVMHRLLADLAEAFPWEDDDEPISGADVVDFVTGMMTEWFDICEAIAKATGEEVPHS